jgi:hypothetical protein
MLEHDDSAVRRHTGFIPLAVDVRAYRLDDNTVRDDNGVLPGISEAQIIQRRNRAEPHILQTLAARRSPQRGIAQGVKGYQFFHSCIGMPFEATEIAFLHTFDDLDFETESLSDHTGRLSGPQKTAGKQSRRAKIDSQPERQLSGLGQSGIGQRHLIGFGKVPSAICLGFAVTNKDECVSLLLRHGAQVYRRTVHCRGVDVPVL